MDFKQIEAFVSVAKFKSFSKAASTIFLSQPTISCHISSLEKELKIQLFDRTSKEVNLTPAGESFLEYAINIINTRNSAVQHISNFNKNICGKLNLAASTTPCNTIVPNLIEKFSKMYPEVLFNITEQSSGKIIESILQSDCELGIVGSRVKDDKINYFKLMDDELVLVSTPKLNIPDEISIESLLKCKFIGREKNSATRRTFEEALKLKGVDPTKLVTCCEVNSLDTLLQFVKTGIGVSVLSKQLCEDHVQAHGIKLSIIKGLSLKREIFLATSSKRTLTPTGGAFYALCKTIYQF